MRIAMRGLIALCVLLLVGVVAAQTVSDVTLDENILVDLTGSQNSQGLNLVVDSGPVNVNVGFLGAAFSLRLEAFDAGGAPVADETISAAGDIALNLSAGEYIIVASAQGDNAGRAILNFSQGAATDDTGTAATDGLLSGEWLVTYGNDYTTNCPDVLSLADAELPADGSTHQLTFSNPPQPLEFHMAVAPDTVQQAPEFFLTETRPDGTYEVAPGLQGAPYVYRYTVNNPQTITLQYDESLNLSDCTASLTVELTLVGEGSAPVDTPDTPSSDNGATTAPTGDISGWEVIGDASATGDDAILCSAPNALGADWLFDAPDSFANQVANGYGETLTFELRRRDAIQTPASANIVLVVGNGILLNYPLSDAVTDTFTLFEIPLTETAGWVDVDGMFDTSDAGMFQQMLGDVTRVQILDANNDSDGFCLQNPAVGGSTASSDAGEDAATPTGNVPFYIVSQTNDGDGVAVGCEGFLLPQDSGQPFSDNPADNIRASLAPLLAMPSSNVAGTPYTNYLGGQGLSVGQVDVSNGHATVVIDGSFLLMGGCADPQIEAQFLLGIFADPRIESATVITNGQNLKAIADMSGQTGENDVYTRDDIRERQ